MPLIDWYRKNARKLPWREVSDPYKIWVSEIMLQQTRVEQAKPYYFRFLDAFPGIESLAKAERQDVLRIWEGLGYYSRARNMQDAARQIMNYCNGEFPATYEEILKLKGIGPYTAAAISSIAFSLPYAVVDGNVIRVLSRWAGIEDDVSINSTKTEIQKLADELLDTDNPSDFNQGMMELGAVICTPKNPDCHACPVSDSCSAFMTLKTNVIPYKTPKKKVPHHQIVVGVITDEKKRLLIALRPEDKMLGGLWEFPGGKKKTGETLTNALKRELKEELNTEIDTGETLIEIKHTYSHFKITLHAYLCRITSGMPEPRSSKELKWIYPKELSDYPFPKANRKLTDAILADERFGAKSKP